MATVRWALEKGTPDEKYYASEVFRECYGYATPLSEAEDQKMKAANPHMPPPPDYPPDVAEAKAKAKAELTSRCSGVMPLSASERRALVEELRKGAKPINEQSMTTRQRMEAMEAKLKIGDTRFTPQEAQALNEALHGGDPLLRQTSFRALVGAIDKNSPGGSERREVLEWAIGQELMKTPLSEFEMLERCEIAAICGGSFDPFAGANDSGATAEQRRLAALYKDAFARKLPYDAILSLR